MVGLPCPTCVNQDKNPLCNAKNMPCGIVGCAPMLCYTDMETPGTGDIWVGKLGEPVPYDYGGSCGYAASCLGCIPNISVWAKKDPASCLAGCLTCPVKCLGSASVCGTSCCRPCQICCALTCGECCCKHLKCCKCNCNPCCKCCHYGYGCKGPQCKCCSNEGGSCRCCRCWCKPNCCDYGYTPPSITKGKMHRPKGTCPRCWAWWWCDCCPKCPKCPTCPTCPCPKCCTCCPMLPPCCKGNVRSVGYQHQCDWDCGFAGCKADITFLWSCCFLCGEIADLNSEGKFVPRRIHDKDFAAKISVCTVAASEAPSRSQNTTDAPKAETMATRR